MSPSISGWRVGPGLAAASLAFTVDGLASAASYRPLDCNKAVSHSELTICRTYSLGQAEARMATLFGIVSSLVAMGQRADIEALQRQWLKKRELCGGDVTCLSQSYESRIGTLSAVVDSVAARGPF